MNANHEIYELSQHEAELLASQVSHANLDQLEKRFKLEKDVARLDGYLRGWCYEVKLGKGSNRDLSKCGSKEDK